MKQLRIWKVEGGYFCFIEDTGLLASFQGQKTRHAVKDIKELEKLLEKI